MLDAIFMLRLEHGNISDVLDLLEDQVQRLEDGAPTDRDLLRLVFNYLADFPEECHHPKEDLLFRMLQQRDPERAATLVDLEEMHESLARITERLSGEVAHEAPTAALDYELFDRKDHLFNDATENRFAEQRRQIQERARKDLLENSSTKACTSTDEITLFRQLNTVKAFNDAMGENRLHLVAYRAGGYALERNDRWLVDIPDCDEGRAAWSA